MKIKIEKNLLNLATNRVHGAITDRSLARIGLKAEGSILHMSSSDRILAVYCQLDAQIDQEGTTVVPGRLFSDLIKELPNGLVEISLEGNFLHVSAGGASEFSMKLPVIEDGEWKEETDFQSANTAEIPASKISYMIDQVQMCILHESPRNYGAVGYMHKIEDNTLRIVGTDGFRLSFCDVVCDLPRSFLKSGICLSKRGLGEIARMCNEGYENVTLTVSEDESVLQVAVKNYHIYTRLSSVRYPKYQGVIPSANLEFIKLSKQLVQSVTKRVMLASDKTHAMQLTFSKTALTLSSKTMGSSEGRESIPLCDVHQGQDVDLSVNGKFLTDVFSTIASDELTLQYKSKEDSVVLIPKNEPDNCKSMHVLVPIRDNV